MPLPSVSHFHELFRIDPETGWLLRRTPWITNGGLREAEGARAGSVRGKYRCVRVDGKNYSEHRVIFAMTHGYWPMPYCDHINGDPSDSRPCNLREATNSQNQFNSRTKSNNKLGAKGVREYKPGRFRAHIKQDGKERHLGVFSTAECASAAYKEAAKALHGDFYFQART